MRDGGYTIYIAVLFSRYAESERGISPPFCSRKIFKIAQPRLNNRILWKISRFTARWTRSFRRFSRRTPTVNEFVGQTVRIKLTVRDIQVYWINIARGINIVVELFSSEAKQIEKKLFRIYRIKRRVKDAGFLFDRRNC